MIEEVVPSKVASAELLGDPEGLRLFPEEEAAVSRAVANRRREFTTVRHCARQALATLGHPAVPLVPDEHRAPVWPDGIVGSMTHCTGYRAAAVAHRTDITAIGLDAEPDAALPGEVLGRVATSAERRALGQLADSPGQPHWDRLLFSAKESVYKAWFPLMRTWLGFEDAAIEIDPAAGTFRACILNHRKAADVGEVTETGECAPKEFRGRWIARDGLIITAIARSATS